MIKASVAHRAVLRSFFGPWETAILLVTLLSFGLSFAFPPDYNYWWHLADGRYMVLFHRLPVPDPFSFTEAGQRWIAQEWLGELALYIPYRIAGYVGPAFLFAVLVAASALLTMSTLRRLGTNLMSATLMVLILIAVLLPWTGPRSQVPAFALMAAVIWFLEHWLAQRGRGIWALPVLFCLWGNSHGSFAVGLAVPALLLTGEAAASWFNWTDAASLSASDRRQMAAVLAASVAAIVLNPNGPKILLYPFSKLHDPLLQYLGPWSARGLNDPVMWPFFLLVGWYLALVALRRLRLSLAEMLLAGAFIAGALWSFRFVPFAAIVLVTLMGHALALPGEPVLKAPRLPAAVRGWFESRRRKSEVSPAVRQATNLLLVMLAAAGIAFGMKPYDPTKMSGLPIAAVDALGAEGLPGPIFHDYTWGGYLIWRLWPATMVFIDGRGPDLYEANGNPLRGYFDVVFLNGNAEDVLDRYGVQTVLFPKDAPLTRYLEATGTWQETYDDGQVVRLERAGAR